MIHVHIYEVIGKAEIDVEADHEHDAMAYALSLAKDGSIVCSCEPEARFISMAFGPSDDDHGEKPSSIGRPTED